ncbi:MAG: response regulator transcription factor [bacterium]|nr:response regulator transcription factor [bacterium]
MIKVIIVEDNETIREGLTLLIDSSPHLECPATFDNCEDMLSKVENLMPDLVLMDIGLPGMDGIEGVRQLRKLLPEALALMLTVYEDNEKVFDALCAGAGGYLVKNTKPARLVEAIVEAVNGGSPMSANIARKVVGYFHKSKTNTEEEKIKITEREREILTEMSRGCSYQQVGDTLFISVDTVRHHIRNIYRKMQVHSQSEAVTKALRKGWI